jgi:hypothetical protein
MEQLQPCLLSAINRHPLLYFLSANVLTGIINISIRTIEIDDDIRSTSLIVTYAFVLSTMLMIVDYLKSNNQHQK